MKDIANKSISDLFANGKEQPRKERDIRSYISASKDVVSMGTLTPNPTATSTPILAIPKETPDGTPSSILTNNSGYVDDVLKASAITPSSHLALHSGSQDPTVLETAADMFIESVSEETVVVVDQHDDMDTQQCRKRRNLNLSPNETGKKIGIDMLAGATATEIEKPADLNANQTARAGQVTQADIIKLIDLFDNKIGKLRTEMEQVHQVTAAAQIKCATGNTIAQQSIEQLKANVTDDYETVKKHLQEEVGKLHMRLQELEIYRNSTTESLLVVEEGVTHAHNYMQQNDERVERIEKKVEEHTSSLSRISRQLDSIRADGTINTGKAQAGEYNIANMTEGEKMMREVELSTRAFMLVGIQNLKPFMGLHPSTDPNEVMNRLLYGLQLFASIDRVVPVDLKHKRRQESNIVIVYMRSENMKKEAILGIKKILRDGSLSSKDVVVKDSFHPSKIDQMRELTKRGITLREDKKIYKFRVVNRNGQPILQTGSSLEGQYKDYEDPGHDDPAAMDYTSAATGGDGNRGRSPRRDQNTGARRRDSHTPNPASASTRPSGRVPFSQLLGIASPAVSAVPTLTGANAFPLHVAQPMGMLPMQHQPLQQPLHLVQQQQNSSASSSSGGPPPLPQRDVNQRKGNLGPKGKTSDSSAPKSAYLSQLGEMRAHLLKNRGAMLAGQFPPGSAWDSSASQDEVIARNQYMEEREVAPGYM